MNLILRISFALAAIFSLQFISSCGDEPGGCGSQRFRVTAEITALNTFAHSDYRAGDAFDDEFRQAYVLLKYQLNELSRETVYNMSFSLIPSAFATDPCPPARFSVTYTNPIDSVIITSDRPYNPVVGTMVTPIFDGEQISHLKERISEQQGFQDLSPAEYLCSLQMAPQNDDSFQFTIRLVDTLGQIFTTTTQKIFIPAK